MPPHTLRIDCSDEPGLVHKITGVLFNAGYNVLAIPLAAGVLAPIGIILPPAVGAILMSVSTIVVALNAQLLRRLDLRPDAVAPPSLAA